MLKKFVVFSLFTFVVFFSCQRNQNPLIPPADLQTITVTPTEARLIRKNNDFSFKLFNLINQTSSDSNVFISPFSVSMSLGMALNGANGETYKEIKSVLGFDEINPDSINYSYHNLYAKLQKLDARVLFEIANSIWYERNFHVLKSFLDVNRTYFNAGNAPLDFSDPSALTIINNWVNEKTHGKIHKILNYISRDDVLYLINALYFKGTWQYAFDPKYTLSATFYSSGDQTSPCQMMHISRKLPYYANNHLQMALLPYGNGYYNMAIILPNEVNAFIDTLTTDAWQHLLSRCILDSGTVGLPKFKFAFDIKLNDILADMGMAVAFDPVKADFSRITGDEQIWISKVKHKAFVEVNEEGTEAAAVTLIGFERTSDNLFTLTCNRPFVFVIYEKTTGSILFMGKIVRPEMDSEGQ